MRFFFFIAVLACVVAGSNAQWDFLNDIKDWFNNARRQITSRFMNSDTFADFNSTIKDLLSSGNLSSLSIEEVKSLPDRFWNIVGAGTISTLKKDVRDYVQRSELNNAQRVRNELQIIIDTNVSQADAIQQLRSILRDESTSGVLTASLMKKQRLMEKLGNPTDWREQNITNMREILFYLPLTMLTRINDQTTINRLYEEVRRCMGTLTGTRFGSCPGNQESRGEGTGVRAQYMLSLQTWLLKKINGEPETWSMNTFKDMDISVIPIMLVPQLDDDVFMSREAEIFRVMQDKQEKREMVGRQVVEKFLKAKKVMDASNSEVDDMLEELRNPRLRDKVYRTDLPERVLNEDQTLRKELDDYAILALRNGRLDPGTLESIMTNFSNKEKYTATEARMLGVFLPLAPADTLNLTLQTYTADTQTLRTMADYIQKTSGPMAREKLLALKSKLLQLPTSGTTVDLNNVPDMLWSALPMRFMKDLALSNRIYAMNRNVTFSPAQLAMLLSTITTDRMRELPGYAKDSVPAKNIENLSKNEVKPIAISSSSTTPPMPAYSKIGLLVANKAFGSQVNMAADADIAMYLRAADARKLSENQIVQTLELMKDTFPTRGACQVLKDKFANYSRTQFMTENDDEVFQLLSPMDMEMMPICVIAAFGENRVWSLSPISKVILLDRLVNLRKQMLSTDSLTRPMVELIVREGLNAKGWPEVITAADVAQYGELLLFAPTDILNSITKEAAPTALRVFNMLAATALMPCLDGGRRSAISNLVAKALGNDPSMWSDMQGICCLLYALSPGQLSRAPKGGLVSCTCHVTDLQEPSSMAIAKEIECRANIGGDYDGEMWSRDNVRRVQAMAALDLLDPANAPNNKRRKRAVSDIKICNRASVSGVDDISAGELSNAAKDHVMRCLAALGSRYMDDNKARVLLEKVIDTLLPRSYNSLTNDLIRDMNFIMKGIRPDEVPDLPRLTYPEFNDAVAVFGNPKMMFSDEQLRAFAEKAIGVNKWRDMGEMLSTDIAIAGRLICTMNETMTNRFTNANYEKAVIVLGVTLEGCDRGQVLAPLAAKAKTFLTYSGGQSALQVRDLGVIMAGMAPDDVAGLPAEAMGGLTPTAVRSMTAEAISRMSPDQIRNLQPIAARVMSGGQQRSLSGEQQRALSEALAEGGAATIVLSSLLLTLALVSLVFGR